MGHPQVTKMYNEEKLCSVRSLVVVHIVNIQRDLVVMWFIRMELITCSTSKRERSLYVNIANYLHFYYVFSKILHIEYLKNT